MHAILTPYELHQLQLHRLSACIILISAYMNSFCCYAEIRAYIMFYSLLWKSITDIDDGTWTSELSWSSSESSFSSSHLSL